MKKILMIVLLIISSVSYAGNNRKPNSSESIQEKSLSVNVKKEQANSEVSDYELLRRKQNYKQIFRGAQDYSQLVQSERRNR